MSETSPAKAPEVSVNRDWSSRILFAALAGILFLTLYPFEFSLHTSLAPGRLPLFLGTANKGGGVLDVALNVLLFVPFGFGFAAKLPTRGKSWVSRLLLAWIAGAVLSYSIEFLQIYIPARDSGWEDVFSNSSGAALGWILFELIGRGTSLALSHVEHVIQAWLRPWRACLLIGVCFVAWLLCATDLQKKSHFETWSQDSFLVFGNDATGRRPWNGKLFQIQIWDRAVSPISGKSLKDGNSASSVDAPTAAFDFSFMPPSQDGARLKIPFSSGFVAQGNNSQNPLGRGLSLASSRPVSDLTSDLKRTNQFSIRVLFVPDNLANSNGRIVSISSPSGISSLFLGQDNSTLFFWFRNELSVKRPALAWEISKLLAPGQTADLLFSFDGSDVRLYSNGKELQDRYWGPGTALAGIFRHVKQGELNGYRDIFYAVVFLPIGCLLGMIARKLNRSNRLSLFLLGMAAWLMPFILELELALLDKRPLSLKNFCVSLGMVVAGIVWVNADRAKSHAESFVHERP